jgi:hypothetical protein
MVSAAARAEPARSSTTVLSAAAMISAPLGKGSAWNRNER